MKEAFEKITGMPDAWTNPALMVSRNAFIQGWEAALAQPAQEPVAIVHIKDGCLVGSHRDVEIALPDGRYGLHPIGIKETTE